MFNNSFSRQDEGYYRPSTSQPSLKGSGEQNTAVISQLARWLSWMKKKLAVTRRRRSLPQVSSDQLPLRCLMTCRLVHQSRFVAGIKTRIQTCQLIVGVAKDFKVARIESDSGKPIELHHRNVAGITAIILIRNRKQYSLRRCF